MTSGEYNDIIKAESLLSPFDFDSVIADKANDFYDHRQQSGVSQVELLFPFRRYRKQPRVYDQLRYKERNIVEQFINRIKWYRPIVTRYNDLTRQYMAFRHLMWIPNETKSLRILAERATRLRFWRAARVKSLGIKLNLH